MTASWDPLVDKTVAMSVNCDSTAAIIKVKNCYYNGKQRLLRHKHIKY